MSKNMSVRKVVSTLGFHGPLDQRPKFHANDTSLDVLNVIGGEVAIEDARTWKSSASLDVEGFVLVPHRTAVSNFRDQEEVEKIYPQEVRRLVLDLTGADEVVITGPPGLRFGERAEECGALNNSRPARFVHIDGSDQHANLVFSRVQAPEGKAIARLAQYNIWRVFSPPPQDVPLALCDARSVSAEDLVPADAIFDKNGEILFTMEGLLVKPNPTQRWVYYSDMTVDEALVFKTNDQDPARAHFVPHGAFDDPSCPPNAAPRSSVEMRCIATWYE